MLQPGSAPEEISDPDEQVTKKELICMSESCFAYVTRDECTQKNKLIELEIFTENTVWKAKIQTAFKGCTGDIIAIQNC